MQRAVCLSTLTICGYIYVLGEVNRSYNAEGSMSFPNSSIHKLKHKSNMEFFISTILYFLLH
jgi:hypothetical protein